MACLLTAASVHAGDLTFSNRPSIGDTIAPQRDLFICDTVSGARYMSNTGFLASGCARFTQAGTWSVVDCTRLTLAHGPWWLIEVVSTEGVTAWIPLPWHDWA